MEIEVRHRERHDEALGGEGHLAPADLKDDVLARKRVDLFARQRLEALTRLGDEGLHLGIAAFRHAVGGRENALLHALDRAERVVLDGFDLEAEGQHVRIEARLEELVRVDVVFLEVG